MDCSKNWARVSSRAVIQFWISIVATLKISQANTSPMATSRIASNGIATS